MDELTHNLHWSHEWPWLTEIARRRPQATPFMLQGLMRPTDTWTYIHLTVKRSDHLPWLWWFNQSPLCLYESPLVSTLVHQPGQRATLPPLYSSFISSLSLSFFLSLSLSLSLGLSLPISLERKVQTEVPFFHLSLQWVKWTASWKKRIENLHNRIPAPVCPDWNWSSFFSLALFHSQTDVQKWRERERERDIYTQAVRDRHRDIMKWPMAWTGQNCYLHCSSILDSLIRSLVKVSPCLNFRPHSWPWAGVVLTSLFLF